MFDLDHLLFAAISEVKIGEYHLDLIPFDADVLSLELNNCFKECFLVRSRMHPELHPFTNILTTYSSIIAQEGDKTSLFYTARALMKLQALYGIIPLIRGKGAAAQQVAQMMLRMRHEMRSSEAQVDTPAIAQLVLIDRTVDLVTPLPTQLTYEGLIDEFFSITNSAVDLPASMVVDPKGGKEATPPADKKLKTPLNSNDKIFRDIRDLNFSVVGPILNQKAKMIDEYYKARKDISTVSEIKDYMKKFTSFQQDHQFLRVHTNITEALLKITTDAAFRAHLEAEQNLLAQAEIEASEQYIEECINKQEPLGKVLRLLCLMSLTQGGLKEKVYNFFTREIIQTYGFEHMYTLSNLGKVGLFKRPDQRTNLYEVAREQLRLITEVDERDPNDISYVFSGYAPLSIRLFELLWNQQQRGGGLPTPPPTQVTGGDEATRDGWLLPRQFDELVKALPGTTFHAFQKANAVAGNPDESDGDAARGNSVTVVCFIGGVTLAEIAALRFLNSKVEGKDIIIATTNLINGSSFLDGVAEDLAGKKDVLAAPAPVSSPPPESTTRGRK
jgi:vacuolar protein sorting-associated protein 33A